MLGRGPAGRRRRVHAMVGHNYRRVPALALARGIVAQGRIGQVRQVRCRYLQDWLADDQAPMTWRLRRESAGSGVLGDLGSHAVDQLRLLLGEEVTRAAGQLRTFVPSDPPGREGPEQVDVDDAAWATLTTSSGAVASLEVSRMATGRKNSLRLEVYGSTRLAAASTSSASTSWASTTRGGSATVLVTEPEHPYLGRLVAHRPRAGLGQHLHHPGRRPAAGHRHRHRAHPLLRRRPGRAAGAGGHRGQQRARRCVRRRTGAARLSRPSSHF